MMPFDQYNHSSDDALLLAYADGDPHAARILTERLMPRVFSQAYRYLRNQADAEDVTQEAFMRLWKIAPDWRQDEAQVSTWLYRVVSNLCTDRTRKHREAALEEGMDAVDPSQGADAQMQDQHRVRALADALSALPDRQREAITLRHLEELGNPDIAEKMDVSIEAVESLISRGKRALKSLLQGRKHELGYEDDRA